MKTRLSALALAVCLLTVAPLNVAAKEGRNVSVPVSGTFVDQAGGQGKFAGTLTILRFAAVNNRVHAVGTITGTLTDSQGRVLATGLQSVSLPVTLSTGQAAAAAPAARNAERSPQFTKASYARTPQPQPHFLGAGAAAAAAQGGLVCEILRLSIGAINLDLLGLTVALNPVLLVISAVPGAGNLLGNLLCSIVGLLDGLGNFVQIVNLLNQLLALLAQL